jgi:putative endonuclease
MPMDPSAPVSIGAAAERRVAWWYRLRGWRVCARNWVGGGGELDLVVSRWSTLAVVEVRRRETVDQAAMSVDRAKLERTIAAAHALVRSHRLQRYRLRIDVAAVDARGRIKVAADVLGSLPGR